MRNIFSYAKVQALTGNLIRGRSFQLSRTRVKTLKYLNIGCGRNAVDEFINADYLWWPKIDLCWDITKALPFANCSMAGIYSEHCIEHFSLPTAIEILEDMYRILAPENTLRIVVPDGEAYLRTYHQRIANEDAPAFPFGEVTFNGLSSPILNVNRVFYQDRASPYGHCFMYDYDLLEKLLTQCGFRQVSRQAFRKGAHPQLLIDSEARAPESLYVEAVK